MAITLIHTADWQIGKTFGFVTGDASALLRAQRIKTVQRIAQEATRRAVDAVLVAGDIFETNLIRNETLHSLLQAMSHFKGPWVLIPGNHDAATAESVWDRFLSLNIPPNIHVALEPTPIFLADGRLAILPAVLRRRHEFEDLTSTWDAMLTPPDAIRVGIAHGTIEGILPGSDSTNPISADRARSAKLSYLALGDWHGTYEVSDSVWYSGTPEPERFKGNEPGNVLVVKIRDSGSKAEIERLPVAAYCWHSLECTVTSAMDLALVETRFADLGVPLDQHVVEVTFIGTVDLATREALDQLLEKWRGRFTWLRVDCSALVAQPTEADLDVIDTAGFVRVALERLRDIHNNPQDVDQPNALAALQTLYQIHSAGGSK